MTTIVVGGHARKVGKTSVAAGLIAAFSQYDWTAVKICSHWHAGDAPSGTFGIFEERDRAGSSDTSRFLGAGASRSIWVRIGDDGLEPAMPRLLQTIQSSPFVMIESNRILRYVRPDIYIMVLRYDVADFKESARETLRQAHAILAINWSSSFPAWKGISQETLAGIPLFTATDPSVIPAGLLDLVGNRLP
jgi:hypothetical protein